MHTDWLKKSIIVISLASYFASDARAKNSTDKGTNKTPEVEVWKGKLASGISHGLDLTAEAISRAIFDLMEEFSVSLPDIGPVSTEIKVKRRIFDNHDVRQSWTVADTFSINQQFFPFEQLEVKGGLELGLRLGSRFGLNFTDIRQISRTSYASLPSVEELGERMRGDVPRSGVLELDEDKRESGWVEYKDQSGNKFLRWLFPDDESWAQFRKYWSLFVFPFRLPVTKSAFEKMEVGEIMTYNAYGLLEAAPSVGWSLDLSQITDAWDLKVGASLYVRGDYRISVMREGPLHAKVKVSRIKSNGHSIFINGEDRELNILDGVLLLNQLDTTIIPFKISVSNSTARSFDRVYRYHLDDPRVMEAFEKAIKGSFSLSDQLVAENEGGVEQLAEREALTHERGVSRSMKLLFLIKHKEESKSRTVESVVRLPDGTRHIFEAIAENSNDYRLMIGAYEKLRYNFLISADMDKLKIEPDHALNLAIEGAIDDSNTTGSELNKYINEVEDAVGDTSIFPPVAYYQPTIIEKPAEDGSGKIKFRRVSMSPFAGHYSAVYGRSSFYYQLGFDQELIQNIINFPPDKMWGEMEKAYGISDGAWSTAIERNMYLGKHFPKILMNIPLYLTNIQFRKGSDVLHAEKMVRRWKRIGKATDFKDQMRALSSFMSDSAFSWELVRLMRQLLPTKPMSFIASGYNGSFGRIYQEGKQHMPDPISRQVGRVIEYDNVPLPFRGDPDAKIDYADLAKMSDGNVHFRFSSTIEPVLIYVSLKDDAPYSRSNTLIIVNQGEFAMGENTLILNPQDSQSPWKKLLDSIRVGHKYHLNVAVTQDSQNWGPIKDTKIEFK